MAVARVPGPFVQLPDPGRAATLDELIEELRVVKVWAGDPSYDTIKDRVNRAWKAAGRPAGELTRKTTVADCFRLGRRRLNADLVIAVVEALHPDVGYVTQWRQALRVIAGQAQAAAQVRVQDTLPEELVGFTGRTSELDRLRQVLRHHPTGSGTDAISTIAGMAGVGKTQLAVHAGHLLAREQPFDHVLFVNLRGFHPDPAQPPADPAAVLDGFLRLLGAAGQQIPPDLPARTAAYRRRLAGTRALVILDNAADADQVRALLPATQGCPVLVTSRRSLTALTSATHMTVGAFTPGEAMTFLSRAAPDVPAGDDPEAAARIARRCGHLPLALGLVAAHMRATPGWTLSDHADRLDVRHHDRRLDTGVELALGVSHQHLPAAEQRQLRLAALHPSQDFDVWAAAALAGADLPTAQGHLDQLGRDHLLQRPGPGRYAFHDLVRAYAISRADDEDPPPERRAALTRLFDFYLVSAATAMDILYPVEAHRRPRIRTTGLPVPALTDPDAARTWLDTERAALVAVAAHAAGHGWSTHALQLSSILFRYLNGGYFPEALAVHGHAVHAAEQTGEAKAQAHALTSLGATYSQLGQYEPAGEQFQRALHLFRQVGDQAGEARVLTNLALLESGLGRIRPAVEQYEQALALFHRAGHRSGQAHVLTNLAEVEGKLGWNATADQHFQQALSLYRQLGDRTGGAWALCSLGEFEVRLGRNGPARDHLQQAMTLYRQQGNRVGEAWTLIGLGSIGTDLDQATDRLQQALVMFRAAGERSGEATALNSLGEAAGRGENPTEAIAHHTGADAVAVDIGDREQQARAQAGLGRANQTPADLAVARHHYRQALALYTDLGMPEADQIRACLTAIDKQ